MYRPSPISQHGRRQRGAALLIVLAIIVAGGIGALFALASPRPAGSDRDKVTQDALNQARDALIGHAASNNDRPGSLPCPDRNNDGRAELFIGANCPSNVGRLPWRTLGLPDPRDSSSEPLWYALSPSLRDHPAAEPINSVDTPAQITVTGTTPASNVAAVIIAPGKALPGQIREGAGLLDLANYLEGQNASAGDNTYETAASSATFNDRVSVITREQLFDVVEWRVAAEIRTALRRYYEAFRYFPYAADFSDANYACADAKTRGRVPNADLSPAYKLSGTCPTHADWPAGVPRMAPPAWFASNRWHALTYYSVAPACTRPTLNCSGAGFLTVNGKAGIGAVVIVGGRALGTQARPCVTAADCIEQPLASTDAYQAQKRSSSFNDRVAVVLPP